VNRRVLLAALGLLLLLGYAWMSYGLYARERVWPVETVMDRSPGTAIAPRPPRWIRRAEGVLRDALNVLRDPESSAQERISSYRERLEEADRMLVYALQRDPSRAKALSDLAAVRAELYPPRTRSEELAILALVRRSSEMAPERPIVQRRLGDLLLRMGHEEEALKALGRTVVLAPHFARPIVDDLAAQWVSADSIRSHFPDDPNTTSALWAAYKREKRPDVFLQIVAERNNCEDVELLKRMGLASRATAETETLKAIFNVCPDSDDPEVQAERLWQNADLARRDGHMDEALTLAAAASETSPRVYRYHLLEADLLSVADRPKDAIDKYRDAIRYAGNRRSNDRLRAIMYRRMAKALEADLRGDEAYDAWKRAARLDPSDETAPKRLLEMKAAAGLVP
jgi:tetratricopeptide (TPR) repeat protein